MCSSDLNAAGIDVPVILGGAALTPRFVNKDCREVYRGQVIYGCDAFADLRFMDAYVAARDAQQWDNGRGFLAGAPDGLGLDPAADDATPPASAAEVSEQAPTTAPATSHRSDAVPEEAALTPPFWGSRVLTEAQIPLEEVFAYLDRNALFAGQWQLRKAQGQSREEYEAMLAAKAEPVLQQWMSRCLEEQLLTPRVAYGYFPCGREGNSVVVFDPEQRSQELGQIGRAHV